MRSLRGGALGETKMSADQRFVRVVTQQDGPRAPWVRGTRGAGSREKNQEERSTLRQRMEALERRAEEAENERDAAVALK